MPFAYKKFSSAYEKRFEKMKKRILDLAKNKKLAIEHIGSTSVRGLGGKGIIDISIGIKKWSDAEEILKILRKIGFNHFHDIENHSLFVSTKTLCEENDFHVHISRLGTKCYRESLAFRDYLRKNPSAVREYLKMKKAAFRQSGEDRKMYKKIKSAWFAKLENLI